MKKLAVIAFCVASAVGSAQVVTKTLIAKMDLTAQHTLYDGTKIMLMGFTELMSQPINIPGPTLEFTEGDSVDLSLINMSQSAAHTIHLHGLDVNQANDGVPSLSFEVAHLGTGHYYFRAPHPGTYIYHCHVSSPTHVQAGMYGLVIVRPATLGYTWQNGYAYDSELSWMFAEIDTVWHSNAVIHHVHIPGEVGHPIPDYYPQYFMINGKTETQIPYSGASIFMNKGETVLVRLSNIGNYGNTVRFPQGLTATVISTDGRPIPNAHTLDTLAVLPGERFGVLLEANVDLTDSVAVDYFDLNTGITMNTQWIPANVSGNFNFEELDNPATYLAPNPATESVTINRKSTTPTPFTITSTTGSTVLTGALRGTQTTVLIEHLAPGLYWVSFEENGTLQKLSLLVQ